MMEGWGSVGVVLKTEMKAQTGVREKERQIGVIRERGRDGAIRRREPDSEQRVFVITSKKKKKKKKRERDAIRRKTHPSLPGLC